MVHYGAKSLPYGGWLTMPRLAGDGWMILGDSASLLNSQRLKGIHLAIKSGMLAAETAFDALLSGNTSESQLSEYKQRVDESWIRDASIRTQFSPGIRARLDRRTRQGGSANAASRQQSWPRFW